MDSVKQICTNKPEFAGVAGETLLSSISTSVKEHGSCVVGLSGGSTPKPIYTWLGQQDSVDWSKVSFFIVDERYIDASDARSNTNMIRSTLLSGGKIKEEHVVIPDTSLSLEECIKDFQSRLTAMFSSVNAAASIIVLGIGSDGHIASLFPPLTSELLSSDAKETVFHTQTTLFDVKDRFSVSLERISSIGTKIFFLNGAEKEQVWKDMQESAPDNYERWPALKVMAGNTIAVTCFPSAQPSL